MNNKIATAFEKRDKQFQPASDPIQASLTDLMNGGTGNAAVAGRPGYVWALVNGAPIQILAPRVLPVAGLPIELETSPSSGLYRAQDVNYEAISGWDGSIFDSQHGQQHSAEGGDPIYLDQRQFLLGLPRAQTTPDMTVQVGQVFYNYVGQSKYFEETTSADLTSYIPATAGQDVWVMVGINAVSNTLVYAVGAEFAALDDPTDYYPVIPMDTVLQGDIRLSSTTTAISQDIIDGSRRAFLEVTASVVAYDTFTRTNVPTGYTLTIPADTQMRVKDLFTVDGTLTATGTLIVD